MNEAELKVQSAPSPGLAPEDGARDERSRDLAQMLEEEGYALVEHLDELRSRLIISIIGFFVATAVGWYYTPAVLDFFRESVTRLIFVAPAEAFFTRLKIAASIGLLLSSPLLLIEAWRFVLPALFPEEKRVIRVFLWIGVAFFVGGLVFGFYVVYPAALAFFLSFETQDLAPAIVVSRHVVFFLGTTLSFGLAFQIPLIFMVLVKLGVFTAERLREMRKPAIFFSFVFAAIFTPTDAISQVLMAVPLAILYELVVRIAPLMERKDAHPDAEV